MEYLPINNKEASLRKNLSDVSVLYENLMKTDAYNVLTCYYLLRLFSITERVLDKFLE